MIIIILLFISFISLVTSVPSPSIYYGECENGACHFKGVHLTENQPHFIPMVDIPTEEVTSVYFQDSYVPLLTSDLCDAFPYTRAFVASSTSIEKIDKNAFINCRLLLVLDLNTNNIKELDSALFAGNKEVINLIFYNNYLQQIPPAMFAFTPQLSQVVLGKNFLKEFPVDRIVTLKELTTLFLDDNLLEDLDDDLMLEKFPELKSIGLCPNDEIPRDRLMEIIANLNNNGIEVYNC